VGHNSLVKVEIKQVSRILRANFNLIDSYNFMEPEYKKYICVVCGFIYDEAEGWPEDGLEPGTRMEDIPDTWMCPDCGVTKEDFELL